MTSPNELPVLDDSLRCVDCHHDRDTPWPTSPPETAFVPVGSSFTYEGAGTVPGPHFQKRCLYCGSVWPEGVR